MEEYFGIPRKNFTFYPNSNLKPNHYRNSNSYHHANPYANHYFNPDHNPISQPNQYSKPFYNPNFNSQETSKSTLKPKVISVPIHFVNSDLGASQLPTQTPSPVTPPRPSPEMAAVKLQKVIRGFLVRKNWSIVRKIEAEAEAIGEEIARDEMILEKEVKARIRVGEMLMRLLFQLDSVRGVRGYRKKVIRKVISLQELVDSIGARGDNKVESDTIEVDRSNVAVDSVEFTAQNPNPPQIEEDKVVEAVNSMKIDSIDSSNCREENVFVEAVDLMKESPTEPINSIETPQMKILDEKPNVDEEFTEAQELDEVCDPTETLEMEESVKRLNAVDQASESSQAVTCINQNNEMEMKGMKDVMERVVVENERMKNLMEELCQSSARQSQLMEGLVDRVQRLEREVAKMEKRDKKKKKGNVRKCDRL